MFPVFQVIVTSCFLNQGIPKIIGSLLSLVTRKDSFSWWLLINKSPITSLVIAPVDAISPLNILKVIGLFKDLVGNWWVLTKSSSMKASPFAPESISAVAKTSFLAIRVHGVVKQAWLIAWPK